MSRAVRTAATSLLDVAYEESGPVDGEPVFLLHGWPDDAGTWDALRPWLNEAGYRTIAPYLRGFGRTSFRAAGDMRSGQIAALASDLVETADALGIERFSVVGHDWGGRTAYAAAALFGARLRACAALGVGYRSAPDDGGFSFSQAQHYWYQWFMRTPLGQKQLAENREAFCRHLWRDWMAAGAFREDAFRAAAASLHNEAWVEVTLHSYLHRWGDAAGDERYAHLEERLSRNPYIPIPALVVHGRQDRCNAPATSERRDAWFRAGYARHLLDNCGHFPQREQPQATAALILRFLNQALGR